MKYVDKLKDERWLSRHHEIMSRDGFVCADCGKGESRLNVHHLYYKHGCEPWEYPDSALVTVCVFCHGKRHGILCAKALASQDKEQLEDEILMIAGSVQRAEAETSRCQDLLARLYNPFLREDESLDVLTPGYRAIIEEVREAVGGKA